MASFKRGNTAYGTTGVKTISPGFAVIGYRLTAHAPGTGNGSVAWSSGSCDGTTQTTSFVFYDGTTRDSGGSTSKVISLQDNVGAGQTEVLQITHNALNSGGNNFKINVNTANANYDVDWEAWSA